MKKILLAALAILALSGCSGAKQPADGEFEAMVKKIGPETVTLDIVEYITLEDTDRIEELALSETDMLPGYCIYNPDSELLECELSEETVYNFIDWRNDFVEKGKDRNVTTTNNITFLKYVNTYHNAEPQMPFIIKVIGGKVVEITEILVM